jgi:hypothetical protein
MNSDSIPLFFLVTADWFYLLIRIGLGVLRQGMKDSTAEEYEGDSDDDEEEEGLFLRWLSAFCLCCPSWCLTRPHCCPQCPPRSGSKQEARKEVVGRCSRGGKTECMCGYWRWRAIREFLFLS